MYVEMDDVRAMATQMTETALDPPSLAALIVRASRMFDLCVGVAPEYFESRTPGAATALSVYGDGTNFLKLPPYVPGTLTTVAWPTGYTAQTYVERDGYLVRVDTDGVLIYSNVSGWVRGIPVTVTAEWGYATTPEDVKAAIIELVINLWRETDPVHAKLVNIEGQPLREVLPPRVKEIAKRYRVRNAVFV